MTTNSFQFIISIIAGINTIFFLLLFLLADWLFPVQFIKTETVFVFVFIFHFFFFQTFPSVRYSVHV